MSSEDYAKKKNFDTVLMRIVDENRGIEGFFDAVFGFLGRGTDFFTREQTAFQTVNTAMTKHIEIFRGNKQVQDALAKKQKEVRDEAKAERQNFMNEKLGEYGGGATVTEISNEPGKKVDLKDAAKKAGVVPKDPNDKPEEEEKSTDLTLDEAEDIAKNGKKANRLNGSDEEGYHWEQSLMEVTVYYHLPDGTKAKDLKINMAIKNCKIDILGKTVLEKEWFKPIKMEDSLWCIETDRDGRRCIQLCLTKLKDQNWWDMVWKGEPKINTGSVEPENSKLSDLEGETRGVVEKMMFDQQQKKQGLPSSDEIEKKDKLSAFMAAHPEMDFSKTKFS